MDFELIDYNATMKKRRDGVTSWYHCVAEDSRIPKMRTNNPLQALVKP